jgi:hypothetical protein
MNSLRSVNLINLFDFYLAAMLLIGLFRRWTVYWETVRLVVVFYGRWPKLIEVLKAQHGVLVTATVLKPLLLAVILMLVQMICSRLIWPQATIKIETVEAHWWCLLLVVFAALPMLCVDTYFLICVGSIDRKQTEQYLDQAEHWLGSWKTPVLRVITLGYVNPQKIVHEEVRKGLTSLGELVSWAAWWASVQMACRFAFGLTIWLLWAFIS